MLFNSIDFAIFFPIVFILYWFLLGKNLKLQNLLLLLASYIFYGWWSWKFLGLIAISSAVDYSIGLLLMNEKKRINRKIFLTLSIIFNISLLMYFKYMNFFIDSFSELFTFFGHEFNLGSLNIILPVGISFYTFQTLSYTIDVYRKKLTPTKDLISFFAFVSFFPQLVAGPIERASNLLPQFYRSRKFSFLESKEGCRQILWGLFKKIVIADNLSPFVEQIFSNYQDASSLTLILGAFYFSIQIYCDFSGYSDIAIGTARLFGFNLMTNFSFPYFSRDIAEFWRRWHISLSTWFRDYIYIPLGGSKGSIWKKIKNVFIIFLISGFWHGANWTFIVWGAINAILFLPLLLTNRNRKNLNSASHGQTLVSIIDLFKILFTFSLVCFAWIFFRAETITEAFEYIANIFNNTFFDGKFIGSKNFIFIIILIVIEWIQRHKSFGLALIDNVPIVLRKVFYLAIIVTILFYSSNEQTFIYFQF